MEDMGGHGTRNDPLRAQLHKQPPQDRVVMTVGAPSPLAVLEKALHTWFVERCDREGVGLEPVTEISEQAHRILRGPRRIALGRSLLDKGGDRHPQRTGVQPMRDRWIGTKGLHHTRLLCGRSGDHPEKTTRIMPRTQASMESTIP